MLLKLGMDAPDTISVSAAHRAELRSHQADILLSVMGSTLHTSDLALKKAKELLQLIGQLTAAGVSEEHITLRGMQAERTSPIIGRANSATYLLRVHCPNLERLPDIMEIITTQRTVTLDQLVWRFPEDAATVSGWLNKCLAEARGKAERIAAGLGVKLLGVHSLKESWSNPVDDERRASFTSTRTVTGSRPATEKAVENGFPLVTTKQVELRIDVEFRISGYS